MELRNNLRVETHMKMQFFVATAILGALLLLTIVVLNVVGALTCLRCFCSQIPDLSKGSYSGLSKCCCTTGNVCLDAVRSLDYGGSPIELKYIETTRVSEV